MDNELLLELLSLAFEAMQQKKAATCRMHLNRIIAILREEKDHYSDVRIAYNNMSVLRRLLMEKGSTMNNRLIALEAIDGVIELATCWPRYKAA